MYLQGYISQAPPCLSTANTDNMLLTTPTYNVVPPIHVIRTGVVLRTSSGSYIKKQVKPTINSQKLSNLPKFAC